MSPVRHARHSDLAAFRRLWRKFLLEGGNEGMNVSGSKQSCEFYEGMFTACCGGSNIGVAVLASEPDKIPYAFYLVGCHFGPERANIAIEHGLFVEKGFRGKGLAKEMRGFAHEALKTFGFTEILNTTSLENIAAIKSLEAQGYKQTHALYRLPL